MRVAAYYAPPLIDPLWQLGSRWLGRDAETNAPVLQPEIPGIAEITADARLYGFHATLKPPMALAANVTWDAVVTAAADVAASIAPFDMPDLAVTDLHGFLAICNAEPSPALQALADACVAGLDHLRAPASAAELAKRRRSKLTPEQDAMLVRWGYPYVFSTWFFHMTLTRRMTPEEHAIFRPAIDALFADTLRAPRRVTDICLYTQAGPGAAFVLAERLPLLG